MTKLNKHQISKAGTSEWQEVSDPRIFLKTPLISVSMITYNHEDFIARAIEGVLLQEVDVPIELVIGEDCSTDATRDAVLTYQKKYPDIIRVIISEMNVGAIENDKRTNMACRGKYVAFCEGDDYWTDPYKLQKQVDFLEANPAYGLVHTDCDHLYQASGKIIKNINKTLKKKFSANLNPFLGLLVREYHLFTCTVMMRKQLLINAMSTEIFCNPNNLMGDTPVWIDIAVNSKLHYIPVSTAVYRKRINSASKPVSKLDQIAFNECSLRVRMDFVKKYEIPREITARVNEMYYSVLLTKAFHTGNCILAKESHSHLRKYHRLEYIFKYYGTVFGSLRQFIYSIRNIRKRIIGIKKKIQGEVIYPG